MTIIDCPRCRGLRFNDKTGRFDLGKPRSTMRIENVMATTGMVHWHCGNCCYKMQTPSGDDECVPEIIAQRKPMVKNEWW